MAELLTAKLSIRYVKDPVWGTGYDKDKVVEQGQARDIVEVEITATTLEKLQEKLTAYVGLAEL